MATLGSVTGCVSGLPRPISSLPLQTLLSVSSERAPQGARWNPDVSLPAWPGKQSLGTDAEHLVLGENDGFVGPLAGAALAPPLHTVSARPELVKINSVIISALTATESIYTT